MNVVIDRGPSYAPGRFSTSYLLCRVDEHGDWNTCDPEPLLCDDAWAFPSLASIYGYIPCEHGCTDGTVMCECTGKTSTEMIGEAIDYIDARLGEVVDSVTADELWERSGGQLAAGLLAW